MIELQTSLIPNLLNGTLLGGVWLGHAYYSSDPVIYFRNYKTDVVCTVRFGWSWWGFFAPVTLGLPLFFHKLYVWGLIALVVNLSSVMNSVWFSAMQAELRVAAGLGAIVANIGIFGLQIWLGRNGGRQMAKNYLAKGWSMQNPQAEWISAAKAKWRLV